MKEYAAKCTQIIDVERKTVLAGLAAAISLYLLTRGMLILVAVQLAVNKRLFRRTSAKYVFIS